MPGKALITGGAGFIGSFVVDRLLAAGHGVRVLDSLDPQVHPDGRPPYLARDAQLVVADVEAARVELAGRGVDVSPVRHMGENGWADGPGGDWNSFIFFDDPDGNSWVLQERGYRNV